MGAPLKNVDPHLRHVLLNLKDSVDDLYAARRPEMLLNDMLEIEPPASAGVYAIHGAGDYVKIGKSKNIAARIKELQPAHPVPLRLLAVLSLDCADENKHHKRWSRLRRIGEWFKADLEMIAHLKTEARRA